jgi:branched-chain amino acid transport system ATP-binding protein
MRDGCKMSGVLLEANAVAKHFGGVKALRDVSLTIRAVRFTA